MKTAQKPQTRRMPFRQSALTPSFLDAKQRDSDRLYDHQHQRSTGRNSRKLWFLPIRANDIIRLQQLVDPIVATFLFLKLNKISIGLADRITIYSMVFSIAMLTAIVFRDSKVYEGYRKSRLWILLRRLTEAWMKVIGILLMIAYMAKVSDLFSRVNFITWAISAWVLMSLIHIGGQKLLRYYRSHGGNSQQIVFIGTPDSAVAFFGQLTTLPYLGIRLAAWFSMEKLNSITLLPKGMPSCSGDIDLLEDWLSHHDIDQIYFTPPNSVHNDELPERLISIFGNTCLPVYCVPNWIHPGMRFNVEQLGQMFSIELWGQEELKVQLAIKRLFDILVSLVCLLFLSPLLFLLGALVKLSSPGPVIYCQDRYGLKGEKFKIYKFRTMSVTESGDQVGLQQAKRFDSRVTPIGRIMRAWSLDELPQLINVLNGTMSLVGPRPHAIAHNEEYRKQIVGYMQRHQLRPGITGLAQVKGFRGETAHLSSMENRVNADLQYLQEWSFSMDMEILLRTVFCLHSHNAY
jgi:putative colanic acid biosynthesis UDP-glucose lipid carrier transferase